MWKLLLGSAVIAGGIYWLTRPKTVALTIPATISTSEIAAGAANTTGQETVSLQVQSPVLVKGVTVDKDRQFEKIIFGPNM